IIKKIAEITTLIKYGCSTEAPTSRIQRLFDLVIFRLHQTFTYSLILSCLLISFSLISILVLVKCLIFLLLQIAFYHDSIVSTRLIALFLINYELLLLTIVFQTNVYLHLQFGRAM